MISKQSKAALVNTGLISLITFVTVMIGIRIPYVYGLWFILAIGITVFKERPFTYMLLLSSIPYTMVMKFSPGGVSVFTYYMLVATAIIVVRKRYIERELTIAIIVFAAVSIIGIGSSITDWIKIIAGFFLLNDFCKQHNCIDGASYSISYALGLIGSSIIGLGKESNALLSRFFSDFNTEYINGMSINRFSALYSDPNYFSVSVVIAVFILLALTINQIIDKRIGLSLSAILLFFGAKSYSKMFFIAIVFCIATLYVRKIWKSKYFIVACIVSVIAAFFIVRFVGSSEFYAGMISRFNKGGVDNGRIELFRRYMSVIVNSPRILTIGAGLGAGLVGTHGAHNTYVEFMYFLGLFGSVSYLYALRVAMHTKSEKMKMSYETILLCIVFLFMIGTLGMLKMNDLMIYYMMIFSMTQVLELSNRKIYRPR